MHLRTVTIIKIIQTTTTKEFPVRDKELNFDFVNTFEASDSWRDFTNKGRLVMPKNIYFRDKQGYRRSLKGTNVNLGGFGLPPLILRGDKITIDYGYKYFNKEGREVTDIARAFTGYISRVHSKVPMEFDLEDNMWQLKQTPVQTHTFSESDSLEDILAFILKGTGFTYNALARTTFGAFSIGNETACQVLERLRKTYGFQSYFRGDELRCGTKIYIDSEAETQHFAFQRNIIEDDLEYYRKDDVTLSAVAYNTVTEETGRTCKDGSRKTRRKRLEVLVTLKNDIETVKVIEAGDVVPENNEGERRTLFFPGAKTTKKLAELALNELRLFYYTGFKGSFLTFAVPFVKQGDNVNIQDKILPERDGLYKVKAVEYSGGVNGHRQRIHLDYKINV